MPRIAVLAVLPHDGRLLLVRRRNPPDAGLWGYPGGHVDWGETAATAAVRELAEETGVRAAAGRWLTTLEILVPGDNGGVAHHFWLAAILCRYLGGEARAADDAEAAEWVPFDEVLTGTRPMSGDVGRVLRLALAEK